MGSAPGPSRLRPPFDVRTSRLCKSLSMGYIRVQVDPSETQMGCRFAILRYSRSEPCSITANYISRPRVDREVKLFRKRAYITRGCNLPARLSEWTGKDQNDALFIVDVDSNGTYIWSYDTES
jgi:hypothetical protein